MVKALFVKVDALVSPEAVPSITVPPLFNKPFPSALRMIYKAALSLTDPEGFKNSALARTLEFVCFDTERILMSEVFPEVVSLRNFS